MKSSPAWGVQEREKCLCYAAQPPFTWSSDTKHTRAGSSASAISRVNCQL